ncbi:hypothetical protein BDR26DRAFT_874676 [Obelidium mucronatum]|nr:hypothetical protein BDR26DRAFT_874676 [Obelidium mucronatum]
MYTGVIPPSAFTDPRIRPIPTLYPETKTQVPTVLSVYLLLLPIIYLIWTLVYTFTQHHSSSSSESIALIYYICATFLSALFSTLMYFAIQPTRLAINSMKAFLVFTLFRWLASFGMVIYIFGWIDQDTGRYIAMFTFWAFDCFLNLNTVKYSVAMRRYAEHVRAMLDVGSQMQQLEQGGGFLNA